MSDPRDETLNADYENITYRTFKGIGRQRIMRWTAGPGRFVVQGATTSTDTSNTEGTVLEKWQSVVVSQTNFKLTIV
jgi:hypothetical protein